MSIAPKIDLDFNLTLPESPSQMTPLKEAEIATIFERTKQIFPYLLVNRETGDDLTCDHPNAEGLAAIFKIKLDEFYRTQYLIESAQPNFIGTTGRSSLPDALRYYHELDAVSTYIPVSSYSPCSTLGDTQSKRKNRKHK
jgi:hypothetical protein